MYSNIYIYIKIEIKVYLIYDIDIVEYSVVLL